MDCQLKTIIDITSQNIVEFSCAETRRLFHGRGGTYDDCSFINVDLFPPVLLVILYDERDEKWKQALASQLHQIEGIDTVVIQNRSKIPWETKVMRGDLPEDHIVEENGLRYSVCLGKSENPGIFLDMRDGRAYLRRISQGKHVLNLFAYTCAFSVVAAAGGAVSVLNADMKRNALNRGRLNHRINGDTHAKVKYLNHNILKSFGKLKSNGPFDLVIVDPPPSQGKSFNLERDYGRILRKAPELLVKHGEMMACLNAPRHGFDWLKELIRKNLGEYRIIKQLGASRDFPEHDPEMGLKIIHLSLN